MKEISELPTYERLFRCLKSGDLEGARDEAERWLTEPERNIAERIPTFGELRESLSHFESRRPKQMRIEDIEEVLVPVVQRLSASTGSTVPNLLFGGFGKCGTTTLHRLLTSSPDVTAAGLKEVRYFNRFPSFSPRLYRAFFPDDHARHVFDGTPGYTLCRDKGLNRMAEILPSDVRFIFSTRNPIDRATSSYFSPGRASLRERAQMGGGAEAPTAEASLRREMHKLRDLLPMYQNGSLSFDKLLDGVPTNHLLGCMYGMLTDRLLARFPSAQVLALTLEEDFLPESLESTRQKLSEFLDIELPPFHPQKLNASKRSPVEPKLLEELNALFEEFGEDGTIHARNR